MSDREIRLVVLRQMELDLSGRTPRGEAWVIELLKSVRRKIRELEIGKS